MPGSVANAAPATVFPAMRWLSLQAVSEWATETNNYPDGSSQRRSLPTAQSVANGAIDTGTPDLTSASNPWVAGDEGKLIRVAGAGAAGGALSTTILTYVSAGAVTLAANAGTTVTAAAVNWGIKPRLRFIGRARLGATAMAALRAFYVARVGKQGAFWFYYPWETSPQFSYDGTGTETLGRYTVRFGNDFTMQFGLARGEVEVELVEIT